MAMMWHPGTGLAIGDPDRVPLEGAMAADIQERLERALSAMILSASGWRGVFAFDGEEESIDPRIRVEHEIILAAAASAFAGYLRQTCPENRPTVVLGMDSRPTGSAIADVLARAFLAEGFNVRYAFIIAAPEIMAYARSAALPENSGADAVRGFVYVSASHNPIGHNGIKFGLADGGVLPGREALQLIDGFKKLIAEKDCIHKAAALMEACPADAVRNVYTRCTQTKREAYSAYLLFTREVVAGTSLLADQDAMFDRIASSLRERPIGIVADFNGSARTLSLDESFLSALGAKIKTMNGKPRDIAHRIVPEGESLEPCRLALEALHGEDPSFIMGFVPDCDGDRGNVVIWDDSAGKGRSLDAQEVFALCCISELAHMVWSGDLRYDLKGNALDKVAVAINDPTSMRIDRIAHAFDVSVFRAEVGEANVVGLARRLRERGYKVRILGEGAAGGNITHPSAVRDPIDTVFALLKLLALRSGDGKQGLFELWCDLSDQAESYRPDFSLADIIATLPAYITTSAYVPEALMKIRTQDHGSLKDRYQQVFLRQWDERKKELGSRYGILSWEAIAYNGMEERRGIPRFGESGRGGLKIAFHGEGEHAVSYIWMRGSGTEPIFRIMADTAGNDKRQERDLLDWQRRMVTEADGGF